MPWHPPDVRHDILKPIPTAYWGNWADGQPVGHAPHRQILTAHACVITSDFDDIGAKPIIHYKKNMQGQLLGESRDKQGRLLYKIFIQGVTEGEGFSNRNVPSKFVKKGPAWKDNLEDWKLEIYLSNSNFDTRSWNLAGQLPDTTVFGKSIVELIMAFRHSPPPFLGSKTSNLIDKHGVRSIARIILKGTSDAGVYRVLSRADGNFSSDDLINAAQVEVTGSDAGNVGGGVYARFHKSSDLVRSWKPNTSYCYMGKTVDFVQRMRGHHHTQTSYGDLTRNSSTIRMIALCVLPSSMETGLFYLAEQIFMCLLQTYKTSITNPRSFKADNMTYYQPAKHFTDISNEVFRRTGWRGGTSRPAFGVQEGANCSTPLMEYANRHDALLFIRTDADLKDPISGDIMPVASFRRSSPVSVTKTTAKSQAVTVFSKRGPGKSTLVHFNYQFTAKTSADFPSPGTPFQLVFEVRKDGLPHPYAWARMPSIGPFKNWGQANSLAIRLDWEFPLKSGKWRYTYIHAGYAAGGGLNRLADKNVPGSLVKYAQAIGFIQWLVGAGPNHRHNWIPKIPGYARVLQAEYDMMNQTIRFKPPTEQIRMLSGARKSSDEIKAEMRIPGYKLQNVDGAFGHFPLTRGARKKCDTCFLLPHGAKDDNYRLCVQVGNSNLCTTCRLYGRPCCSWTIDIPHPVFSARTHSTPEQTAARRGYQAALVFQPPLERVSDMTQSFRQQLRSLEPTGQAEEEASDYEPSDSEVEGDGEIEDDSEIEGGDFDSS